MPYVRMELNICRPLKIIWCSSCWVNHYIIHRTQVIKVRNWSLLRSQTKMGFSILMFRKGSLSVSQCSEGKLIVSSWWFKHRSNWIISPGRSMGRENLWKHHEPLEDGPPLSKQLGRTWRIIPVSKWLVTPIYKPFRPFGRGLTLLRGLTNHGY